MVGPEETDIMKAITARWKKVFARTKSSLMDRWVVVLFVRNIYIITHQIKRQVGNRTKTFFHTLYCTVV